MQATGLDMEAAQSFSSLQVLAAEWRPVLREVDAGYLQFSIAEQGDAFEYYTTDVDQAQRAMERLNPASRVHVSIIEADVSERQLESSLARLQQDVSTAQVSASFTVDKLASTLTVELSQASDRERDSGGPVFSGGVAYGQIEGSIGSTTMVFTAINYNEAALGVVVATS